jgi:hypothetical protein
MFNTDKEKTEEKIGKELVYFFKEDNKWPTNTWEDEVQHC